MSKLLSVSIVGALAIALVSCSESTAPAKGTPRTVSVVATASVPAVPTAPVTVATNTTESKVSATYPVAALQALVAAFGGPVAITMTDVAAKDIAAKLPAGSAALIDPTTTAATLQFSAQRSGASFTASESGSILFQSAGTTYQLSFAFTPFGASCATGSLSAFVLQAGVKTVVALSGISFGPPIGFTAAIPAGIFVASSGFALVIQCQPVTGGFGG